MTEIRLVQGDITRIAADAIVNAANEALRGGGGVDGAIHRVGGPAVIADLERRYGPRRRCPTGSAVVSVAGGLPARYVIHAVGPIWDGGTSGEPGLLASAYTTSLDLARQHGCRTVTAPAISTGVYGYPIRRAAPVALRAVADWLAANPQSMDQVTFVLFSVDSLEVFEQALAELG
ncbi:MAG: macro domain-containing protein [Chloroflexota bacterium]